MNEAMTACHSSLLMYGQWGNEEWTVAWDLNTFDCNFVFGLVWFDKIMATTYKNQNIGQQVTSAGLHRVKRQTGREKVAQNNCQTSLTLLHHRHHHFTSGYCNKYTIKRSAIVRKLRRGLSRKCASSSSTSQ